MVNALFIAIHARFVRDMAHLPEGVEVILCAGPEGATRDFDDFSTTEHLIALGRAEASEVVRRYGLGTIAYPAPPMPVPDSSPRPATDGPGTRRAGRRARRRARRSRHRRRGDAVGAAVPGSAASGTAAAGPVTQPDPGT